MAGAASSNRQASSRSRRRDSSSSSRAGPFLEEDSRDMAESRPEKRSKSATTALATRFSEPPTSSPDADDHLIASSYWASKDGAAAASRSTSPNPSGALSRSGSFSDLEESVGPMERLTVFDLLENLSLPQRLERLQNSIAARTEKVRRSQERLKSSSMSAREKVVEEWRRRLPTAEEQLDKYKKRMRQSVDRMTTRWNDSKTVTMWEKASFIAGVFNIFISGYLVGAHPEWFHYWYTSQLLYFMPVRIYTYKKKGYHYFLADLCYFVNFLTILSIYAFPQSKRLLISTFCLAFGNNAIAIAMWRNSLVFHSMDKIVSLFIHIMPCVTLHCLVHLIPKELQAAHYPAIHTILYSEKSSPEHYTLPQMMVWASCPYALWQITYHLLITVRRREKIESGRPTSFTWLRKSYANTWIGKIVLSMPDRLQEPIFMLIQYTYALLAMVPCPLWLWSRWASTGFLSVVFAWSVYNGATYYIDVFGTRFQKELEALKRDVAKWQNTPDLQPKILSSTEAEEAGSANVDGNSVAGFKLEEPSEIRVSSIGLRQKNGTVMFTALGDSCSVTTARDSAGKDKGNEVREREAATSSQIS